MATPADAPPSRGGVGPALTALVAVLTLVTLELVRSSGPLLDLAYTKGGVLSVSRTALLSYLAPGPVAGVLLSAGLLVPGRRRGTATRPVVLSSGVALLLVLRLTVQVLEGTARFALGLATVAVAVAVLTLAVAALAGRTAGGRAAAGAVAAGAAAGVGVHLALGTWDAYWRHTALGWSVTVAVLALLGWLAVLVHRDVRSVPSRRPAHLWALGLFLAPATMLLANPAFAASQSGLPLALAGPVVGVGLLVASWSALHRRRHRPTPGSAAATLRRSGALAVAAVLLVAGGLTLGGPGVPSGLLLLLVLVGAQLVTVEVLAGALEPRAAPPGRRLGDLGGSARLAVTASLVGLSTIAPLLAYQVDYELPLGFPNELVLVLTVAALGAAGLHRDRPPPTRPGSLRWGLLAASGGLVVLGTIAAAGAGWLASHRDGVTTTDQAATAGTGRVVTWNLHYGVSPAGSVDLEATARTLEAQDPDVVLLQEVSRGWVMGGGADMATWLSHRLGRPFVFGPAADRQFGNLVMARQRPTGVGVQPLPYGQGPQRRSAISAQVRVGGEELRVTSVHLQHRGTNTPTRLLELETMLATMSGQPGAAAPRIVGGDFNAERGSAEITEVTSAGFVSAVDTAGDPGALTIPSLAPRRRIDWVFGRGVGFSAARVLVDARSSDHLPVVATRRR